MKKLLILGGSQQIGRLFIEKYGAGLDYNITLFNRNQTNPNLFPEHSLIIGDRNTDEIDQIFNQTWDIILDCSCYNPFSLDRILKNLKNKIGRYILISTISVYDYDQNIGINQLIPENFPKKQYITPQLKVAGNKYYGRKKTHAEKILIESGIKDYIILRPHFVYGTYDWQQIDYYWFFRIHHNLKMIIPDDGSDLLCLTYIHDLVAIIQEAMAKTNHNYIYNVTTHNPISLSNFLDMTQRLMKREMNPIYISSDWLMKHDIKPISFIPLWSKGSHFVFDNSRLLSDFNFVMTPFRDSLETRINEYQKAGFEKNPRGISRRSEEELIAKYLNEQN